VFLCLFETVISWKLFFISLQKILDFLLSSYYIIDVATTMSEASALTAQSNSAGSGSPLVKVSRGMLSLTFPSLKTGRATFTASGFQKSLGC
jgi:hypothetical protein